jgi:hypothetical protein
LCINLAAAIKTFTARNVVEGYDAIAGPESGDSLADCGDYAGRLMSIDARRGEKVVFDFFEIGVADAAGLDTDENFAAADCGSGDLLDIYQALAAINGCVHGFGYRSYFRIGY